MRFEHLIEINALQSSVDMVVPGFTVEQLWRGLMLKVREPQRFPMGPDQCTVSDLGDGQLRREQVFGPHALVDLIQVTPMRELRFTPQAHGGTTPIQLTISLETPQPGQLVLRYVYEAMGAQSAEESYFNEYRHSAWLAHDRDTVRTLRQWLTEGGLDA
ncbi:MAG: hypothetical protein RI907_3444 [Pseudomonadota bacterium]|jgi:hypothetical protein